jgi:hypothetical protein
LVLVERGQVAQTHRQEQILFLEMLPLLVAAALLLMLLPHSLVVLVLVVDMRVVLLERLAFLVRVMQVELL